MKIQLALVALLTVFAAKAAVLEKLDYLSNSNLEKAVSYHKSLASLVGDCSGDFRIKIAERSAGEKTSNIVKQAIYKFNQGYSYPESVSIKKASGVVEAVNFATYHILSGETQGYEPRDSDYTKGKLIVSELGLVNSSSIYVGAFGNSFGSSQYAAVVDTENNEMAIMDMGYCE